MSNSGFKEVRNRVLPAMVFLVGAMLPMHAQKVLRGATVIQEVKHDVSLPLWEMAKMTPLQKHANREMERPRLSHIEQMPGEDTAVQRVTLPQVSTTNLLNFDGQGADGVAPPDTEGAVGATQYVQWVNTEYNVYNKTTGAKVLGPVSGNAFWSGFGGSCQTSNSGDIIVQYDKTAQRWFFSQPVFTGAPYMICVAVSTSSDATGTYHRYAFTVNPSTDFPDYPKWGIWPDGYYLSFNGTSATQACSADRTAMLAGSTATMQCFALGFLYSNILPSDLDGTTPPPTGSPNYYVSLGNKTTSLYVWQFHVDFVNPSNSTFTGPTSLTVPNYSLICGGGNIRSCIPEPSPGEMLDSLSSRYMYRNAYRNFGTHESLVGTHTVKPGSGTTAVSAVRWYEIRSPKTPTLYQSGTLQHPTISIWMPSIAMDKNGDIALGLSAASPTLDPSIAYLGRVPTDPLGTMESPATVVVGTGVQESTSNRWGDYSAMNVDPTDDCTFWYTQEYIKTTGAFHWSTRINSFKFNSCH